MKTKFDWSMTEWRDYYDTLAKKAYQNHQETGESRYDRENHRYEIIVKAFNGYLAHKSEEDEAKMKRLRNVEAYIKQISGDVFTRAEVLRMIREVGEM